jgi:dTDP-4-dehydrorhamnose 3,5-epimerase
VKFTEAPIAGVFVIDIEPHMDDRGFFSRTYCAREFEEHGLTTSLVQTNVSYNHVAGTLRGMHMQVEPAREAKLVRCTHGGIHDVIVDMREESDTYLQHFGVDLTAESRRALYVPEGFAHGYLTLTDDAEVEYHVSEFYTPEAERGFRHDDPAFGIEWPRKVTRISPKDAGWPLIGG